MTATRNSKETVIPDLQPKINKVLDEHSRGQFIRCSNKQELHTFLDSL